MCSNRVTVMLHNFLSSISPQTVLVDTWFCVDDSLQTWGEKQLTCTADIASKYSSVKDQWRHQVCRQSRTTRQPSAAGKMHITCTTSETALKQHGRVYKLPANSNTLNKFVFQPTVRIEMLNNLYSLRWSDNLTIPKRNQPPKLSLTSHPVNKYLPKPNR